jgi:hypothetical protein
MHIISKLIDSFSHKVASLLVKPKPVIPPPPPPPVPLTPPPWLQVECPKTEPDGSAQAEPTPSAEEGKAA